MNWTFTDFGHTKAYDAQGERARYSIAKDPGTVARKRGYSVSADLPGVLYPVRLGYFTGLAAAKAAARDYDRQEG